MLTEKPWRAEALMMFISFMLSSIALGALLSQTIPGLLPDSMNVDRNFLRFIIGTLTIQGAALVLIHYFLRWHHVRWREILLSPQERLLRVVGMGVGVGLLVVPVAIALLNFVSLEIVKLFQIPPEKQTVVTVIEKTVEPAKRVWFALVAIVLAPAVEEIIFRGIMYPYLKQQIKPVWAVTITSLMFAAIHFNVVIFIPLVFLGFVLTWLYEKTDSLLTPILTHGVFNAINFFMLVYQDDLPRWFHERV